MLIVMVQDQNAPKIKNKKFEKELEEFIIYLKQQIEDLKSLTQLNISLRGKSLNITRKMEKYQIDTK